MDQTRKAPHPIPISRTAGAAIVCNILAGRTYSLAANHLHHDGFVLAASVPGTSDDPIILPARLDHQAHLPNGAACPAASFGYRARSDRGRRRVVGRRHLHRQSRLEEAPRLCPGPSVGRGTAIPRGSGRRTLPDARRLEDQLGIARPAARGLGLSEVAKILRDDHSEAVWRPRLLRLCAFGSHPPTLLSLFFCWRHREGAELARPRRTAAAIRHQGTTGLLAAASR